MDIGNVRPISIEREMREAYLDYAMSVITARALPDVRDGLKPVQRRVLYAMDELSLRPTSPFKKSARIVGEVLGKYHPHSDAPVYETMVRLAQTFSMRYPLVDGQGNFGSVDGDPPAAMRYTEARLSPIAEELLADIDKNTVDFEPNFDGSLRQPSVLPAKVPNLLVNGTVGIAVGMATNIPPHNLSEVIDAVSLMIGRYGAAVETGLPFDLVWSRVMRANTPPELVTESLQKLSRALNAQVKEEATKLAQRPTEEHMAEALLGTVDRQIDVTPDELMAHVKGPDFPTSGIILGDEGIKLAYTTGHGRITIRAKAHTEDLKGNREAIVVTELPYQVNKATLVERIAELVRDKRVDGISDMRDESDRQGMRLVIELKRDTNARALLNQLFKMTALQSNFSINMLALVDGQPRVLTLKQILLQYLNWRHRVLTRRTQFELEKAQARAHILEGLKIALDNLDAVIRTIRASRDTETARTSLMTQFKLSEIQATAILDMQLRRLAALERQKILDELKEVKALVARLEDLLANPVKLLFLARDEMTALKEKFGDERKTKILAGATGDLSAEDLVPDQDVVVISTVRDYVRRLPGDAFRVRSTSRALPQTISREDDAIRHLIVANTRDTVLFFTNRGKVYAVKCHDLPEAQAKARGLPISNVTGVTREEKVTAVVSMKDFDHGGHFVLVSKLGEAKRIRAEEYRSTRAPGLIAMDLEANDELVWVGFTPGKKHIMVLTEQGQSIRFREDDLRSASRTSGGVRAIKLDKGDRVVDANVAEDDADVLLVTARGYGKRIPTSQFSVQGRGGGGIRAFPVSDKTGRVVVSRIVRQGDEVMIASRDGLVVRTAVQAVPPLGRTAQGAVIIHVESKDQVAAMARLRATDGGEAAGPDAPDSGPGPRRGPGAPKDGNGRGPSPDGGEPAARGPRSPGDGAVSPNGDAGSSDGQPSARTSARRGAATASTPAPAVAASAVRGRGAPETARRSTNRVVAAPTPKSTKATAVVVRQAAAAKPSASPGAAGRRVIGPTRAATPAATSSKPVRTRASATRSTAATPTPAAKANSRTKAPASQPSGPGRPVVRASGPAAASIARGKPAPPSAVAARATRPAASALAPTRRASGAVARSRAVPSAAPPSRRGAAPAPQLAGWRPLELPETPPPTRPVVRSTTVANTRSSAMAPSPARAARTAAVQAALPIVRASTEANRPKARVKRS